KEEWEAAAGSRVPAGTMKIETRGVVFNRASGEARTDQPVQFTFANGSGNAVGAIYHSEEGTLQLQREVKLKLDPPVATGKGNAKAGVPQNGAKEPIEVSGSRMDFNRDAATMALTGPAEAKTTTERLSAAAFLLNLDGNFRAKRLVAKGGGSSRNNTLPEFTA